MRRILVGDPHVKLSNLQDSENLLQFIFDKSEEYQVDRVEFLGDLFDTHSIIRVEVLDFWTKWLKKLSSRFEVIVLVGNHDLQGSSNSNLSSLNVFKDIKTSKKLTIVDVDSPFICDKTNTIFISYQHDSNKFLNICSNAPEHVNNIVAHQTFQGAHYENGFYAEDGINLSEIKQENIISGHIHASQTVGKCWYPGTPKWDTSTDSNKDKGIWLLDGEKRTFISTYLVVTPCFHVKWEEGSNEPEIPARGKIFLELIGNTSWINSVKKKFKNNVNIKGTPTDRSANRISVSRDSISIINYLDNHFNTIDGIKREDIKDYLKSVGFVV